MTRTPDRFRALDAWRGISALLVALEHLNVDSVLHHNNLVRHGFRFVDFFFVLSGFVIAHSYRERLQRGGSEVRSFLVRRVGRLWPLHVVILGAFIAFEIATLLAARAGISIGHDAFTDRNTGPGIVAHLALVQGLGIFDHLTWNGPSWSISTEVFAYALFALVCATVSKRIDWLAALLVVGCGAIVLLVAPHGMGSTFDYGLFRCVYGFMTGVLVRRLYGRYALRVGTIGELAIVVGVVATVMWLPTGAPALLVTPIFALAVWVFAGESGALSRVMQARIPQVLGAWSYSIYMVHVLIAVGILSTAMLATRHGFHVFTRLDDVVIIVGPIWFTTAVVIGYVGLVLAVAAATYRLVEVPGQRLFKRWAAPAAPQAAG